MTAQVIYAHSWLDCPDDMRRYHNSLQDKINEAKATFWHDLNEQGIRGFHAQLCYDRFIHASRDRLHIVDIE